MMKYIMFGINLGASITCCIFLNDALRKNYTRSAIFCFICVMASFGSLGSYIYEIVQSLI